MIDKTPIRISFGYLVGLLTMSYTTLIVFPIATVMDIAGQDGWLSMAFGVGFGFIVLGLAHFAGPRHTGMAMPVWIETVLGKIVGRLLNVLFLLHFIIVLAIAFCHTTDLISIAILRETPTWVLLVLLGFPVALAAHSAWKCSAELRFCI